MTSQLCNCSPKIAVIDILMNMCEWLFTKQAESQTWPMSFNLSKFALDNDVFVSSEIHPS